MLTNLSVAIGEAQEKGREKGQRRNWRTMGNAKSKQKKRLANAGKGGVLVVSQQKLKKVPEKVLTLTNLTNLDLSGNLLKIVPETFGALQKIKILYLHGNRIEEAEGTACIAFRDCRKSL